jgi:hypothetical protein
MASYSADFELVPQDACSANPSQRYLPTCLLASVPWVASGAHVCLLEQEPTWLSRHCHALHMLGSRSELKAKGTNTTFLCPPCGLTSPKADSSSP